MGAFAVGARSACHGCDFIQLIDRKLPYRAVRCDKRESFDGRMVQYSVPGIFFAFRRVESAVCYQMAVVLSQTARVMFGRVCGD